MRADRELITKLERFVTTMDVEETYGEAPTSEEGQRAYLKGFERGAQLAAISIRLLLRDVEPL